MMTSLIFLLKKINDGSKDNSKVIIDEYENQIFAIDSQDYGKTNSLKVTDIAVYAFFFDSKFSSYVHSELAFNQIALAEEDLLQYDIIPHLIDMYRKYRIKEEEKEDTKWL